MIPVSYKKTIRPWVVRAVLAAAALISLSLVVYASLVPLNYTPKTFDETFAQFQKTPWIQLGIESRADWVANGLVMLPAGFLAAGAIDWRRKRRWLLLFASPFIVALLVATVFAIEFVQIWFPPRVVSQNDIFAGAIGSLVGVLLWWLVGRSLLGQIEQFLLAPPGLTKWKLLMNFGVIGLLIYNLMPLDLLISFAELREKFDAGAIRLIPFQEFHFTGKAILFLAIAWGRLVPYAFVATLQNGIRHTIVQGLMLALLLELVKVPIHSRPASATGVVASALGVLMVACGASLLTRWLAFLDRAMVWCIAALGWTGVMLVSFLGRFDSIERDPAVLVKRLQEILVVPFARAHASSEFEAGENILVKLIVFGALTFLLSGWCSRLRSKTTLRIAKMVSIVGCVVLGLGIEVGQVFLPPLFPDATDFILYGIGGLLGVLGFRMLIPAPASMRSSKSERPL